MRSADPICWRVFARALRSFIFVFFLGFLVSGEAQASDSVSQAGATAYKNLAATQGQSSTLVVGSEQDFPPFATGMTDTTAGGFTVDLWKAVAAEAGLNYSIRVRPFHQLLQEFNTGQIDVLINLAQSDERRKLADFTVPHVVVHGAIFVRKKESDISSEVDLAGKSIIVLNGDLAHDYAVTKGWTQQLVLVETAAEGLRLLASGQHDAMLLSKLTGMMTLQELGLTNVEALKAEAGFSQKFAFAAHRGAIDLLAKLNEGLALTKSDGTYNALYEKWFGVYEMKEVGLRDLLRYFVPLLISFLLVAGYFFFRWQVERNRVQAAITESRNLLMTVIDTAPTRVFWKDRNSRYLGCNMVFARDAGMEHPKDLIGKSDYQLGWAANAAIYQADDQAVMTSGVAKLSYDEEQTTPTGQTIWLRTSKVPLKNRGHEIIGLLGVYEDNSERNQSEQALRESEQRFRSLIDHNNAVILQIDPVTGQILDANAAAAKFYGWSHDELCAKTMQEINTLDPVQVATERIAARNELRNYFVFKHRLANGEIRTVEVHSTPIVTGNQTLLVSIVHDITERARAEEKVSVLMNQQKAILNSDLVGIVTVRNRIIVWANPAFEKLMGYAPGELTGMPTKRNFLSELAYQTFGAEAYPTLATGAVFRSRIEHVRKDGSHIWVETNGGILDSKTGESLWTFVDVTERQFATLALRESENRFHVMADSAPVLIWMSGIDKLCNWFNKIWLDFTGRTMNQEIGNGWAQGVHPDDYQRCLATYVNAFDARQAFSMEFRLRRVDGEYRWLVDHSVPRHDDHGVFMGYIGSCFDITDRKQMEDKLLRSETRLSSILENASDAIFIIDQQGRYCYVNQQATQLLGYSRDELLCMQLSDITPPEDLAEASVRFQQLLSTGTMRAEIRLDGKDGKTIPVEISATLLPDGSAFGSCRDITERKRATEALRQSERELKEVQVLANIGNWQWDLKTGEHFWSEQIFEIYGRDQHEPAASYPQVQSYFTAESWVILSTAVERCLTDGVPYERDAEVVRPNGMHRWIVVFGEAVKNEVGTIVKLRGTVQDITDRKQAQQKLNDLNRDFVAFLENTSDFVYFKDKNSRFRFCSQTLASITGHTSWRDMIGKHDLEVFPNETAQIYHEEEIPIFQEGKPLLNKVDPFFDAAGRKGWVSTNKWPLLDQENKVVGLFGISRDFTDHKRLEEKLIESESYLQAIIRNEPECITVVDAQGILRQMNPAGLAMVEADALEQVAGKPILELIAPEYHDAFLDLHKRVLKGETILLEFQSVGLKGGRRWLETHAVSLRDQGKSINLTVTRDVTQRKQMEERVRQLAFHDTLTNLPNRRLLTDRMSQDMLASKRSGKYAALMFLDLDNVKPLNDAHGHEVGDLLLLEVARRLQACVRGIDTVARVGGDEFVLLLSDLDTDCTKSNSEAAIVAEKVRAKLAQPYLLCSKHRGQADSVIEHHCSASIGVVTFFDHVASQDDILKWADDAMYRAKALGRNAIRFYDPSANAL